MKTAYRRVREGTRPYFPSSVPSIILRVVDQMCKFIHFGDSPAIAMQENFRAVDSVSIEMR
jgi:hypothetical protein